MTRASTDSTRRLGRAGVATLCMQVMAGAVNFGEPAQVSEKAAPRYQRLCADRLEQADSLWRQGRHAAACEQAESVATLAESVGLADVAVRALIRLSAFCGPDLRRAIAALDHAATIRGADQRTLLELHHARGDKLLASGRAAEALTIFEEAKRISQETRDQPGLALAHRGAARAKATIGRPEEALDDLHTALQLAANLGIRKLATVIRADRASILLSLGRVRSALGDARSAVKEAEGCEDDVLLFAARRMLLTALCANGLFEEADIEITALRAYYRRIGECGQEIEMLLECGFTYHARESIERLGRTVQELESLVASCSRHPELRAESLALAAFCAEDRGDTASAEETLRQAIVEADDAAPADVSMRLRGHLAALLRERGRSRESVVLLEEVVARLAGSHWRRDLWWYLGQLGDSQAALEMNRTAGVTYGRCVRELAISNRFPESDRFQRLFPPDIRGALWRILEFRGRTEDIAGAFEVAEIARSWIARERASVTGGAVAPEAQINRRLATAVRDSLRPGELFVEYVIGQPISYVFVLDHGGMRLEILSPFSAMAEPLTSSRLALSSGVRLSEARPQLALLSDHLITTFILDPGDAPRRLIVVRDTALSGFPFEVLPLARASGTQRFSPGSPLLIEKTTITYALSAATWLAAASPSGEGATPETVSAVVSAEYADPSSRACELQVREFAEAVEGRGGAEPRVSALHPGGGFAYPRLASRLLHLLPAVYAHADEPERAGLRVDGRAPETTVALLSEIGRSRCRTDLTVLSALDEAGPPDPAPIKEAVIATLLAKGGRSVLVPAWQVDDENAATFLAALHEELQSGLAVEDAVRQAKLALLARHDSGGGLSALAFCLIGRGERRLFARSDTSEILLMALTGVVAAAVAGAVITRRRRRHPPLRIDL